jgi:hypothetical protein
MKGAGRDATRILLAGSQAQGNDVSGRTMIVLNHDIIAQRDENIALAELTVDGNAPDQNHTHSGVGLIRSRGAHLERVRVTNCRGTASSGPNETFHFETQLGTDTSYVDCEAVGTSGSTASGFSADGAHNVQYVGCVAHGMSVTNGFTHYSCQNVTYRGCVSYANAASGFNSEVSQDVSYSDCTAGGTIGNSVGFLAKGSSPVQWASCVASANGVGLYITQAPAGADQRLIGGDYSRNGQSIVFGDAQSAASLHIS